MGRKGMPRVESTRPASARDAGTRPDSSAAESPLTAATVGTLVGIDADGAPLVDFPANPFLKPLAGRTCVDVGVGDIGAEVVLWFEDGDAARPLVMGCIRPVRRGTAAIDPHVEVDLGSVVEALSREDVRIGAPRTLTLRCGKATITLTRDGQVLINGTYVETRASGTNRVQGGSVRIN